MSDYPVYQTESRSNIFGFAIVLDEPKLRRAIEEKAQIDFVERSGKYFSTVIAHLVCNADGSFTFEGLTGDQQFPIGENVDRILAHWAGFTQNQQERNEIDNANMRAAR